MTIYKVSFVVTGRRDAGGVQRLNQAPRPGDRVLLDAIPYQVTGIVELMPPKDNIIYLHAVCRPLEEETGTFCPEQRLPRLQRSDQALFYAV
jgi:hypothetical protein